MYRNSHIPFMQSVVLVPSPCFKLFSFLRATCYEIVLYSSLSALRIQYAVNDSRFQSRKSCRSFAVKRIGSATDSSRFNSLFHHWDAEEVLPVYEDTVTVELSISQTEPPLNRAAFSHRHSVKYLVTFVIAGQRKEAENRGCDQTHTPFTKENMKDPAATLHKFVRTFGSIFI